MLENALDSVVGVDFDDVVIDWNRQAELTFGWSRDEALGKKMADLIVPEEMRTRHTAGMKRFRETGIGPILNKRIEIIALHRNGAIFPVELTVVPIPVEGTFVFYSFIRDISDRKKIERELKVAKEEAERTARTADQLNHLKDEFLASLSHEIRTPLNAISGFAELIALDLPEASHGVKDSIDAIRRNSTILTKMISDLLDVSKIESGKIAFEPIPVSLSSVTDLLLANSKQAARDRDIEFTSDLASAPAGLFVDQTRLQQIVWNLISNAMKFTPRGGRVRLRIAEEENFCLIEVTDSGVGIDPVFLPQVFDRFRQESSSITRTHGGLGLGLSITRHLVELHGGRLSAASDGKGRGSKFSVRLPLYRGLDLELSAPTHENKFDSVEDKSDLKDLKILVVDDSPDSLLLISRMLARSGARVTTSDSVSAALDYLRSEIPDLLISDIGMPGESGYDLIKNVRAAQDEKLRKIRSIATTAYARTEERESILKAGFDAHISKPISRETLLTAIRKVRR